MKLLGLKPKLMFFKNPTTIQLIGKESAEIKRVEDLPMIRTSVAILKFWSFIINRKPWRTFYCITSYILLNITQVLDIYHSVESASTKICNGFLSMLACNIYLRAFHICRRRNDLEEFLEYMKILYLEIRAMKDEHITAMLDRSAYKSEKLTKQNLILAFVMCVGLFLFPFFVKQRTLVFKAYLPYVDMLQAPWYHFIYFFQTIIMPNGVCMYIPFTMMVVGFMLFAILMCEVLQHKLRSTKGLTPQQVHEEVIFCIEFQLKIIRYVKWINDMTSHLFLFEYISFGFMLCCLLFSMIISNALIQMLIIMIYMSMILTQSFIMYYYANQLHDESLAMANAAYDVDWFDCRLETQHALRLFILRAQQPCAILIGHVYPMNLQKYQSLLNATYSIYTMLKGVYA